MPRPEQAEDGLPVLSFAGREAWREWLAEHHGESQGLWLAIAKKESGLASVSYAEALEVALCFGWIDGRKGSLDGRRWLQRFTPRQRRSRWSKINCGKAEELIARGEMMPAGLREVERAKADGRWEDAYGGQKTIEVPDDLLRELAANQTARANFAALSRSNRYAILYRLHDAKKPETRARRLEQFMKMLAEGKTIHP